MVTMRSPFCVYNTTYCVELNGESLSCYSNKIEWVSLRKCPYDHWLTKKAYLSAITVTNIYYSFTYKMAAKINWHRYGTKLRHYHHLCIQTRKHRLHIGSTSIALGTTDAVSKPATKWKSLGRCIRPKKRNTIVCATHKSDDRFPTWQSVYYNFGISDVVIGWAASLSGRNAVTWRWSLSNDQRVTVDRVSL